MTETVKRFRFERLDGKALPFFSGGAHVVVSMNDNGLLRRNPYSLMSNPDDGRGYEISVLRVPNSRGGSAFMHEQVRPGDQLTISQPVNLFAADHRGRKHILIAGGIGITPFIAMMEQFTRDNVAFELHYAIRSRTHGAYWQQLLDRYGPRRVKIYCDAEKTAIPLTASLDNQPLGTHLYVCGPAGMIDGVLTDGARSRMAEGKPAFRALPRAARRPALPGAASNNRRIRMTVGEHQSILEAVEAAGCDAPYMCRGGACGQCETAVLSCDGALEHNDIYLSDEEKAAGGKIMICVSRFKGQQTRPSTLNDHPETGQMTITFRQETFRDDFTFRNSLDNIRRFPFPFDRDEYMYSVNMEPHVRRPGKSVFENLIDVDEHYVAEMHDRALVLKEDPLRCQALPHMMAAQWDTLELLMEHQAQDYPEHFTLEKNGDRWRWINRPMGIDDTFTFGDPSTLPYPPMEYITRQAQGDFCIVDQRDNNLWMDAGMVTTQADWSLDFDIGMNFMEWHGPVPLAHQIGVFDRALKFLLQPAAGQADAAPELDDDDQSAPRHQPGKLPQMGSGPHDGDAGKCRREGASARRTAEPLAPAALQRHPLRHPLLPDQHERTGDRAEMGPAPAARADESLPPEIVDYKGLTRYRQTTHRLAVEDMMTASADQPRHFSRLETRRRYTVTS